MTTRYAVLNRVSNKVQFTAHIDCDCKDDKSIKIGLAVRWAIKSGADLSGANLIGADLSGADLSGADLNGANLYKANLYKANLYKANLYKANLSGADLSEADLNGADFSGADLNGAIDADYAIACTRILPDGDLIGWKKCKECSNGIHFYITRAEAEAH